MGRRVPPSPLEESLVAELRAIDVELFDPPVAPPRVPVPSSRDPQRLALGFADRRARARFLGRCTTEVAERCRGGASAACALAVARFDGEGGEDDEGGGGSSRRGGEQQQQHQQRDQQQPTAKRRARGRRPWWARMLLLPGPRREEEEGGGGGCPRARCEADAARACRNHARAFCRALVDEANGDNAGLR